MGLIFFSKLDGEAGEGIRQRIETEIPEARIETHRSIEALSIRLQEPRAKPEVAVLHASSREELFDLLSLADLLRDVRIILILPDRDPWTVARGHKLRPRFVSDPESDYGEITVVLKHLLPHPGNREDARRGIARARPGFMDRGGSPGVARKGPEAEKE